jgi:hypothetical protein
MKTYSFLAASLLALSVSMPAFADDNVNMSHVDQIGTGIKAKVTQDGSGNKSTSDLDQGLVVTGSNLDAKIHQGGTDTTSGSIVKQDGANQSVELDQHGAGGTTNTSMITQDGDGDSAIVNQNGTGNTSDSTTEQHGMGTMNEITVDQGGMGSMNSSMITQSGGGLIAHVVQN